MVTVPVTTSPILGITCLVDDRHSVLIDCGSHGSPMPPIGTESLKESLMVKKWCWVGHDFPGHKKGGNGASEILVLEKSSICKEISPNYGLRRCCDVAPGPLQKSVVAPDTEVALSHQPRLCLFQLQTSTFPEITILLCEAH